MEGSESAVNAPHPDGEDEAELFFGGEDDEDGGEEAAAAEAAEAAAADDANDASEAAEKPAEEGKPAEAAADPTPPAASAGPTEDPTPPTPASGGASSSATGGDAEAEAKKSGQLEREYVVLQRVPLTKAALEHLLKEVTDGKDARVAFLEVQRPVARNDRQAIGLTYKAHRAQLGATPKMVAVSSRSFKERNVKPKEKPVEESLEIS